MNARDTATLIGIGGILYLLYVLINKADKPTQAASDAIAALWLKLFPNPAPIQVLGSVQFPDGTLVPLADPRLGPNMRSDSDGNVFVMFQGHVYQLAPHDANGNYPATLSA